MNTDEKHEFYDTQCTYLTEAQLEQGDLEVCKTVPGFATIYSTYTEARDALTHARIARGFYPVVMPEGTLRHLKRVFPNKGKARGMADSNPLGVKAQIKAQTLLFQDQTRYVKPLPFLPQQSKGSGNFQALL